MDSREFDFPKSYVLMSLLFAVLTDALCMLLLWAVGCRRMPTFLLPLILLVIFALSVVFYNRRHDRPAFFGARGFGLVLFYDDSKSPIPDLEGFDISARAFLLVLGFSVVSFIASCWFIPPNAWDLSMIILPLFVFVYTEVALAINNLRRGRTPFCGQLRFFKALAAKEL